VTRAGGRSRPEGLDSDTGAGSRSWSWSEPTHPERSAAARPPARRFLRDEAADCPADLWSDSAKMNVWWHKALLARIAAHGGNVRPDHLD